MKKFFTLISFAFVAVGVSAQTETYTAVSAAGLAPEFAAIVDENGNATNETNGMSAVSFNTKSITGQAVGGANPANVYDNSSTTTDTHVDITAEGIVGSWNPVTWASKNQGDISYYWISGSGVPYVTIAAEAIVSDGEPVTYIDDNSVTQNKYRAAYTYYTPDGVNGMPVTGLYYKFSASQAGTLKVGVWVNKGNRNVFVVDEATKRPVSRRFEGYINGQNNPDNTKKYLTSLQIDSIHTASGSTNDYIVGAGNQPFFGYMTFDVEAGKTYWVLGDNWQIGFQGYEFIPGSSTDISETVAKSKDTDAPVYNLAGQRVGKEYKGVVVCSGRKYIQN